MRELLRVHLTNAGYEVELAEDGIQAASAALREPPDLVLCDLDMPYMNGAELLAALRAEQVFARLPVIMLTAQEDADVREAALAAGASDFLVKPIRSDVLLAVLAKHLGDA